MSISSLSSSPSFEEDLEIHRELTPGAENKATTENRLAEAEKVNDLLGGVPVRVNMVQLGQIFKNLKK